MLKLILGRNKTGKTKFCLDMAEKCVNNGKNVIMLVPEQYSFECQRHLLCSLGPKISNKIDILSFTGLCNAIQTQIGGIAGLNIDDGTRYILVGQAIASAKNELQLYGKYCNSQAFIREILSVITELKQSKISPEILRNLSENADSENLKKKLLDISNILEKYDALVKTKFIDPLDLIENTVNRMSDNSFFKGKTVIFDEFKGFTEAQFLMIHRIISGADNVYVTLCCDGNDYIIDNNIFTNCETDVFYNITKTADRLMSIAKQHLVTVEKPLVLNNFYGISEDLIALDKLLCRRSDETYCGNVNNISVISADSVYDEIDFCMSTIRKMVRVDGYRYKDFTIISRSDSVYQGVINEISEIYNIPCYIDKRISASVLPLSNFVLSAINAALSFDTEDILRMAKTGLAGLSVEEIAKIENYAFIWSIDGLKKWSDTWTMSCNGLSSGDISDGKRVQIEEETKATNALREKLIAPLIKLRFNLNGNAETMCKALFELFKDYSTVSLLKDYTLKLEQNGQLNEAEYQRAGYEVLIKAFDKIVEAVGDRNLEPKEFSEILASVIGFETVGEIPQNDDQVIFGTADRIKPLRPKVVFVVGVNQDIFPQMIDDSGLLSQYERSMINKLGSEINNNFRVCLSDHSLSDCIDESFLFYSACTYASDKVFLSYSAKNLSGGSCEPSIEIETIKNAFPKIEVLHYSREAKLHNIETKESAFKKLAENYCENSEIVNTLKGYFSADEDFKGRIEAIDNYRLKKDPKISEQSALKLYGDKIYLSASKIDSFADCRFMYFCKFGLELQKLQKVEFNPLTRGNIVHYCLEKFVSSHINEFQSLDDDFDIASEVSGYCDDYINNTVADIDALDDKFKYMISVAKETSIILSKALAKEFKQGEFQPKFCELKIGPKESVKGIEVKTDNGQTVTLTGYIDRVDTNNHGKVRVVDYKTGKKGLSFSISELLNSHNAQMLLYLYSLIQNGKALINADTPAGVLYFPAMRQASDKAQEYVKMSGIVLNDTDTLKQMEKSLKGKIIPVGMYNNGHYTSEQPLVSNEDFENLFKYLEIMLQRIGSSITNGNITPNPLKDEKDTEKIACKFCDFSSVCRKNKGENEVIKKECSNSEALEAIREELTHRNGN